MRGSLTPEAICEIADKIAAEVRAWRQKRLDVSGKLTLMKAQAILLEDLIEHHHHLAELNDEDNT